MGVAAPVRTAYAANPTVINFTSDTTALGLHTIEARSVNSILAQNIEVKEAVAPLASTFPT